MIKIEIDKNWLIEYVDKYENNFNKLWSKISIWTKDKHEIINNIKFKEFKLLFIKYQINLNNTSSKLYHIIYEKISSDKSNFYKEIRKYIINQFTDKIKFCPYCGKVPLIYFDKNNSKENSTHRLFQFDHFFPKEKYPTLSINFYNLIPSCNACNHLKLVDNPFNVMEKWGLIFHPYYGFIKIMNKKIRFSKKSFDSNLSFVDRSKFILTSAHWKFFKLSQKYLNSQDTFNEFDFIYDKYTKIKDTQSRLKKSIANKDEMIDYFFKNYYPENESDILKYSNWKFKKDLIEDMRNKLK